MKNTSIVAFICIALPTMACAELPAWTWTYAKRIAHEDTYARKKIEFKQTFVHPFTQLMFSWNALRPERGYFSFHAQVYSRGQWQELHHMIDWGQSVQRSHNRPHVHSSAYHVRLEVPTSHPAQGFRVIAYAHEGASLSDLKALFVCTSDFNKFMAEEIQDFNLRSVKVNGVPQISQMMVEHPDAMRICSPTSTCMLVSYLQKKNIDPAFFAQKSYDAGLDSYGSWPFNMAHAYEHTQGAFHFCTMRMSSFTDVHKQLMSGIPVVVSVRGEIPGGVKPYNNGHLMIIVGWDAHNKKVLCHDPAFATDDQVFVAYNAEEFIRAWERSNRLAYVAMPIFS